MSMNEHEFLIELQQEAKVSADDWSDLQVDLAEALKVDRGWYEKAFEMRKMAAPNATRILALRTVQGAYASTAMQSHQINAMHSSIRATMYASASASRAAKSQKLLTFALVLVAIAQVVAAVIVAQ